MHPWQWDVSLGLRHSLKAAHYRCRGLCGLVKFLHFVSVGAMWDIFSLDQVLASLHVWPVLVGEINRPGGGNNIANIVYWAPGVSKYFLAQWNHKYSHRRQNTQLVQGSSQLYHDGYHRHCRLEDWLDWEKCSTENEIRSELLIFWEMLPPFKHSSEKLNDFFYGRNSQSL